MMYPWYFPAGMKYSWVRGEDGEMGLLCTYDDTCTDTLYDTPPSSPFAAEPSQHPDESLDSPEFPSLIMYPWYFPAGMKYSWVRGEDGEMELLCTYDPDDTPPSSPLAAEPSHHPDQPLPSSP